LTVHEREVSDVEDGRGVGIGEKEIGIGEAMGYDGVVCPRRWTKMERG
jgi:hypothetical protein